MDPKNMQENFSVSEFKTWLTEGIREYGSDAWIFIRELAQNSRDAGADRISISTEDSGNEHEIISFSDNGSGMSMSVAKNYLLRLYSSTKEHSADSAGQFGIGFWTVFRFNPDTISIESFDGHRAWKIDITSRLRISRSDPEPMPAPGTRITLTRKTAAGSSHDFLLSLEKSVRHYCQYIEKKHAPGSAVKVYFNQKLVSKNFYLCSPGSRIFKTRVARGVVSLGPVPQVQLYSRGLPVWQGASLADLTADTDPASKTSDPLLPGISPRFRLELGALPTDLSRRMFLDHSKLKKIRGLAERELSRLFSQKLRQSGALVFPGCLPLRFFSGLGRKTWFRIIILLIIILPLEICLLRKTPFSAANKTATHSILDSDSFKYSGSLQHSVSLQKPRISLTYTPQNQLFLRIFALPFFSSQKGFLRKSPVRFTPANLFSLPHPEYHMQLNVNRGGRVILPCPTGMEINRSSVTLNRRPLQKLQASIFREVAVLLPRSFRGLLRYQCGYAEEELHFFPNTSGIYTALPENMLLPDKIVQRISQSRNHSVKKRVALSVAITAEYIRYTRLPWAGEPPGEKTADWLTRVLRAGNGDCDIVNGFLAVLLRKQNIPCQLVIGLVGKDGRTLPGLHSWVEYYAGRWYTADATHAVSLLEPAASDFSKSISQAAPNFPLKIKILYLTFMILSLLLFLIFVRYLLNPRDKKKHSPLHADISRMAVNALINPGAWGFANSIWIEKFIPMCRRRPISLKKVMRLARHQPLFLASAGNPLLDHVKTFSPPVADITDINFRKLFNLLPNTVNLDSILSFIARQSHSNDNQHSRLIIFLKNNCHFQDSGLKIYTASGLPGPCLFLDLTRHFNKTHNLARTPLLLIDLDDPLNQKILCKQDVEDLQPLLFELVAFAFDFCNISEKISYKALAALSGQLLEAT